LIGTARTVEQAAHRQLRERQRGVHKGSREIFETDPEEALQIVLSFCGNARPVIRYKDFVPKKLRKEREALFWSRVTKLVICGALAIAGLALALFL
jgi:hypothetical protein